jgi:hypothetical protein
MLTDVAPIAVTGSLTLEDMHASATSSSLSDVHLAFAQAVGVASEVATLHVNHARIIKPWTLNHQSYKINDSQSWFLSYEILFPTHQKARIIQAFLKSTAFVKLFQAQLHKLRGFAKAIVAV